MMNFNTVITTTSMVIIMIMLIIYVFKSIVNLLSLAVSLLLLRTIFPRYDCDLLFVSLSFVCDKQLFSVVAFMHLSILPYTLTFCIYHCVL